MSLAVERKNMAMEIVRTAQNSINLATVHFELT